MAATTAGERKNGELLTGHSRGSRFTLLYNGEGIKYTIGQEFVSRESQGEYLFCYGKGVAKSSHCEITCGDEGQFWVKDLQGLEGNGTFINGERIDGVVELKFGDYLSLGDPESENQVSIMDENKTLVEDSEDSSDSESSLDLSTRKQMDGHTVFFFKAVEKYGDSKDVVEAGRSHCSQNSQSQTGVNVIGESTPLRNTLVLSKILAYLPLSDVRNCRLVCSEWNEEATKLLKTKSVFSIHYVTSNQSQWINKSNSKCTVESSRLFCFVQEMGGFFPEGRFSVSLPNCTLDRMCRACSNYSPYGYRRDNADMSVRDNSERKMMSDLEWFFGGGFPHPIISLSLSGTLRSSLEQNVMLAVLNGARHHLQELDLTMNLDLRRDTLEALPLQITFPSLKALTVTLYRSRFDCSGGSSSDGSYGHTNLYDEPCDKMKNWIISMIAGAPALKSLELGNCEEFLLDGFAEVFLDAIIKEKGFPNLNSLDLFSYNFWVLDSILNLPKLKSLTLGVAFPDFEFNEGRVDDYDTDEDKEMMPPWTVMMAWVLDKSAETLKYLDLTLPRVHPDRYRDSIDLPVFENLEVFKLCGFYADCVSLPDIGLDFGADFPLLNHLSVRVNFYAYSDSRPVKEKDFFDIFFNDFRNDEDEFTLSDADEDESSSVSDDDDDSQPESKRVRWNSPIRRKSEEAENEQVIKSLRYLEIQRFEEWSPAGMDEIDKLFPNAFNKHLESVRAKALARPKWNWSKWSFVSGAEETPVKPKPKKA